MQWSVTCEGTAIKGYLGALNNNNKGIRDNKGHLLQAGYSAYIGFHLCSLNGIVL